MIIFTLRRLLLLLVTLFFLTFVGFSLSYFTPHAPLQGSSLWDAWLFWFNGVLHWDFGVSSINGQLISEQLKEVFPATMELCILAFGFALMVGIPVGMLAGIYRNKWQDKFISAIALLGFSIPVFWLALLLTLFFSLTLGWLLARQAHRTHRLTASKDVLYRQSPDRQPPEASAACRARNVRDAAGE